MSVRVRDRAAKHWFTNYRTCTIYCTRDYAPHSTAHTPLQHAAQNRGENDVMRVRHVNLPRRVGCEVRKLWWNCLTLKPNCKNVLFLSPIHFGIKISVRVSSIQWCWNYCRPICRRVRIQQSLKACIYKNILESFFRTSINQKVINKFWKKIHWNIQWYFVSKLTIVIGDHYAHRNHHQLISPSMLIL